MGSGSALLFKGPRLDSKVAEQDLNLGFLSFTTLLPPQQPNLAPVMLYGLLQIRF